MKMLDYEQAYEKSLESFGGDSLATSVFLKKYAVQKDGKYYETSMSDMRDRLANGIMDVEPNKDLKPKFRDLLNRFLPAGRICYGLSNPNDDNATFSNCYVVQSPTDSLESIFKTAGEQARIFSRGGGVGIDVSKLRPVNAKVNNVAKTSTGSVSFMDLYSMVTGLISQNSRRGALMLTIDCKHPDLIDFIKVKGGNDKTKVQFANISIKITDDFMKAVESDSDWEMKFVTEHGDEVIKTEKASLIWDLIVESNWKGAEPGQLYWDKMLTSPASMFEYSRPISTNPCFSGDTIIKTNKGYVPIKSVIDNGIENYMILTKNLKTNEDVFEKIVWGGETSNDAEIIDLVIETKDGDKKIKCTPNHLFYTKNRGYVEAQYLTEDDDISEINI